MMITASIRKQGGAAIVTIPADVLKILDVSIGSTLELEVSKDSLVAHPVRNHKRKRYTLDELLSGVTLKSIKALNEETNLIHEGDAKGKELL